MRWGFVAFALALAACGPKPPGPDAVVTTLYAPYVSHAAEKTPSDWDKKDVYSKPMRAALDRAFSYSTLLNEPVIDYDPIADGQEFSITNLAVTVDKPPADGKAHVTAKFLNLKEPDQVGYDMVLENGAWKIDNISNKDSTLRKLIDDALKPIGDVEKSKALIETLYADREKNAAHPLDTWAPLSKGLKSDLHKMKDWQIKLGFDPLLGGPGTTISGLKLEAASAAVIARFMVDGAPRVVVYDMADESSVWSIADIRGPLATPPWDLLNLVEPDDK